MKSYFFLFDFLGGLCYTLINRGFKKQKGHDNMKEIWIDNYSISETGPGYYLISMNGTPCMSFTDPRGLTIKEMNEHLLEYINRKTMIDVNTKAGVKDE